MPYSISIESYRGGQCPLQAFFGFFLPVLRQYSFQHTGPFHISSIVETKALRETQILSQCLTFKPHLTLSQTTCLQYKSFENTVSKGEIYSSRAISPFHRVLSTPFWITFCQYQSNLKLSSANSFSLEESRICHLRKGLFVVCKYF